MERNVHYLFDMYNKYFPDYCDYLIRVQKGQIKRIILFEKDKIKKIKMTVKGYKDYKNGIKGIYRNG